MYSRLASAVRGAVPLVSVSCQGLLSHGLTFARRAPLALCASAAALAVVSTNVDCASYTGVAGTRTERSFIAIKPDGVQRGIVGEIITRFEKGYKLVAMKLIWPTQAMAAQHYADLSTKPFFPKLTKFFSSGPIVAMVWEGPDVIRTGRKMLGATNPAASEPGTIRGDYCLEVGKNIIHGSDSPEAAAHEIGMWFSERELSNWARTGDAWIYE